ALIITWAFELTPEGVKRASTLDAAEGEAQQSEEPQSDRPKSGGRQTRFNYLLIGGLSLAVVFLLVDEIVLDRLAGSEGPAQATDASAPLVVNASSVLSNASASALPTENAGIIPGSIAILPF